MIKTKAIFQNGDVIDDNLHDLMQEWFENNVETTDFSDVDRETLEDGTYIVYRDWDDENLAKQYVEFHKEICKDYVGWISCEIVS